MCFRLCVCWHLQILQDVAQIASSQLGLLRPLAKLKKKVYLFILKEREREREREREGQRKRERQISKQACAVSIDPEWWLNPTNHELMAPGGNQESEA